MVKNYETNKLAPGLVFIVVLATAGQLEATARNHEIPGQATSGQPGAAALSVRVFYQSASTVPRSIHLIFPLYQTVDWRDTESLGGPTAPSSQVQRVEDREERKYG